MTERDDPQLERWPDRDPGPDEDREGFCPTCGDRLSTCWYPVYLFPGYREAVVSDGWEGCERCADEAAHTRLRKERPWLFAVPDIDDADDCSFRYYVLMED